MNFSPLDLNKAHGISTEMLKNWGRTLAVAPHPGDEALGCGGTLALLSQLQVETAVLWVSDGAASHPNSLTYAAPKLANLREAEGKAALEKLGVGRKNSYFLRLPDGKIPFPNEAGFDQAVAGAQSVLEAFQPQTLLLPWRRDSHRDQRASWQLLSRAAQDLEIQSFEYLLWAFERAEPQDWPQNSEASAFTLDVSEVKTRKLAAIQSHASQTTHLIKDDPAGFWFSPEFVAQFDNSHEAWIAPFCSIPEVSGRSRERSET
ncbi:PIG-L deacetylase family protein [Abditibacterium utsteinense]|nr:PIG-L deacetylase family protein [Abditibacterium utsteinense]